MGDRMMLVKPRLPVKLRWRALALFTLVLLGGCKGPDAEMARLCADIIPAFEPSNVRLRVQPAQAYGRDGHSVRINFAAIDPDGSERQRYVACAFTGGGSAAQTEPSLIAVESDDGQLNEAQLFFLQRFFINSEAAISDNRARLIIADHGGVPQGLAYLAQAILNALPWTAIITLLATAYSLLYGLSHRINLAFGDIAVIGAYAVVTSLSAALALGGWPAAAIALGVLAGVTCSALAARSLSAIVIRPLVDQPGRMLLVATIGVELVIQEGLRVTHGAGNQWLNPILATPHVLFTGGGFPVHVTTMQAVVAASALALALLTLAIMRWTRFGMSWRALSEDRLAACLCGVSPAGILTRTMIGAGLLSGACGAIITLAYGNAHYALGTMLGLKAIIAAILGGIGSIAGALLGGLLLGLFEGLWSAYLSIESRDIAVYCMLSILLIVRPGGILGLATPSPREV